MCGYEQQCENVHLHVNFLMFTRLAHVFVLLTPIYNNECLILLLTTSVLIVYLRMEQTGHILKDDPLRESFF